MTNKSRSLGHIDDDDKFAARLENAVFSMRRKALAEFALGKHEMPAVRGVFGNIGQALETSSRGNAGSTDAPGLAGQVGDIDSGQDNGNPAATTKG